MICYELYLRSFFDGNADGIGDLDGLECKLDYLIDLGIDCVWLLPIMSSPAFHGYTISDFKSINSLYGDFDDLDKLLSSAHRKGIKIVLDIPVNHVSVCHEWFIRALQGEKEYEEFFTWADKKTDINELRHWGNARIWHNIDKRYFYGLFGPGSPDLNFENPLVVEKIKEVFSFWLGKGFDGFRLDAAKHIFDYNTVKMRFEYQHDKNIAFWKEMRKHILQINKEAVIISEVWDSPEIVKKYEGLFEIGFNFPFSYSIKDSVKHTDASFLADEMEKNLSSYFIDDPVVTKSGNFLTNHDMTRLYSELGSIKDVRFAFSILFTLPGIPFIYYGEELAMQGKLKNVDFTEDSEEPIQWYELGYGYGQTEWKGFKFNPVGTGRSVQAQSHDKNSFLSFVKKLILFRKENIWIENAKIQILGKSKKSLSIKLSYQDKEALVIYNFSSLKRVLCEENSNIFYINNFQRKGKEVILGPKSVLVIIRK